MKQTLKYILSVIMDNLKFAEGKHSIIIALNAGIIVLCINFFSSQNLLILILNYGVIFFCGASIIISAMALLSRSIKLKGKKPRKENINLLYFKDLSHLTYSDLLFNVIKKYGFPDDYKADGLDEDLCKQIIANAKVASIKFYLFNRSIWCFISGLFLALIMFFVVGFKI